MYNYFLFGHDEAKPKAVIS